MKYKAFAETSLAAMTINTQGELVEDVQAMLVKRQVPARCMELDILIRKLTNRINNLHSRGSKAGIGSMECQRLYREAGELDRQRAVARKEKKYLGSL